MTIVNPFLTLTVLIYRVLVGIPFLCYMFVYAIMLFANLGNTCGSSIMSLQTLGFLILFEPISVCCLIGCSMSIKIKNNHLNPGITLVLFVIHTILVIGLTIVGIFVLKDVYASKCFSQVKIFWVATIVYLFFYAVDMLMWYMFVVIANCKVCEIEIKDEKPVVEITPV